ncbi:citron Rho-interacting kinase-like isoform X3 [Patiria miniata]|uniref:non-specific serine/threonine protein kinase n=1 Tax=Patiria miniata TaxID=46514 RepID=A0A913ZT97_PATMI|nr:citron Rho-interacting kinase-like isoform X3 [Patiria miniata]
MSRPGTRPTAMGTRGISARTSGLNQLFMGKTGSAGWRTHIAREGLLDALLVLYEECHSEQLMKDKHIASFVDKYKSTINEVKNLRISINDFEVKKVIGRGHFGEVQVVREKTSGDVYAMKILRKDDTLAKENVAFFEEERDIMARASNEWLTHLQYAFQDTTNLYLIMEFHPGGDMLSLLSRFDDVFEESMAQFYLAEMVAAIHSLHTMGYVHRDIKPDNILVDRTGHIKLADFGSAAKLSSDNKVCAKMPVGTPDYVAPEVLMSMNSKEGTYGLECDWWSLGIVAYEMLFGKTPFTEDSIVVTYSNIMDFKNKLKFPSVPEVSHHAKNLMQNLLSDKLNRLGYEGLGCHPFFSSIEWATLRQSVPPFVPTVTSVDDTSNFDDFDPEPLRVHFNFNKPGFSGRDLPFIGFTYTKELASITAVEHLRNTANQECASPMTKNNLERRLAAKTQELQDIHSKYHKTEGSQAALTKQVSELQGVVRDKTVSLKAAQAEKMALEKDLALSVAEIANMKRMLEMERSQIKASDSKAVQLLGHIREANKKTTQMKDEEFRAELEEHQQAMSQLELDRYMATQRASKMEGDLKMTTKACEEAKAKVIELQAKLAKSKEASRQQVKELQAKLDEISTASSNETTELRKKLSKAVESSKEATELMVNLRQEKNRLQDDRRRSRMQRECCQDMRNKMQEALDCQTSLEHRLHTVEQRETRLIEEVQAKHGLHQDLTKQIIELEEKYEAAYGERKRLERSLHKKEAEMEQRVKDLQQQLAIAKREQHHVVERRVAGASQEHQVKIQEQEATISMLKSSCVMLEEQIVDMEALSAKMEEKETTLRQERDSLNEELSQKMMELQKAGQALETEKQAREWSEQKVKEANNTLQEKERTHKAQIEMWQAHVEEHKQKAAKMAQSMNELEKQHAVLEVNLKEVEKACSQEKDDNKQLEKEVSELTGQLQKNKTTTFKLTQSLEQAIERGEQLKAEGQDLENQMETMQVQHTHEKVKLEGTLAQQTKLIDFLQAKVEAPPKKKKKRLFGKSTKDSTMSSIPMQYKELQQALEMERSRKQDLQRQLTKTKAELQVAKMEANTKPRSDFKTPKPVGHTANPHLLSAIVLSPTNQPSPSLFTPVPNARASSKRKTAQSGKEAKRLKERMKHNIPHRLVTGLNTRATKCAVCVDTVHFGRQCAKCQECHQVCHLKCASSLPHTCGLPSQYVQHFSQAMHCKTASPKVGPIEGENGSVTLQSWMKIPRNGKSGWDKKWVVLEGTKLCIYDKENTNGSSKPGDEFDLCPSDGRVTIHAGVTAAELGNTASTDLTYVLRIELHPHTTCWPGRTLFLMASSFSDKQKWMMTLEFVMSEGSVGAQVARDNARLLGNTLLSLEGENKMDINCTLLLSQELMLIGSEDGLFAMASTDKPQPLSQLNGVDSVFQMKAIAPLGIAIMTVGPERRLCFADLTHLKTMASQASVTEAVINYTPIENIQACHLFAYGAVNGAAYICAATPQKIRILKHSKLNGVSKFSTRKEINTSEPCSCLLFTPSSLLAGTDRFYQIDLDQYQIDEFLDSTDTSLAFAVFGASQVNSFPIAVVQIAPDGFPKEYLLCFHEFGVFVDGKGRRTRPEDMKWSRLPLAFMFRGPYLYVTHFNSMEVCEIKPIVEQDSPGIHTFLDLASPRLVGHGMTPGTAYVTSTTDTLLDLICLKGHTTQTNTQEEPRRPLRQHSGSRGSTQNNGSSLKRPLSEASANQPSGKMLRSSFQNSSMMSRQSSSCSSSSTSSWASSLRRSPRFRNMSSSDEESVTSCSSLHKRFTPSKQGKFTAV